MVWVTPFANMLMWISYLIGAFGVWWGVTPELGGWRTLNAKGKLTVIGCGILCVLDDVKSFYYTIIVQDKT